MTTQERNQERCRRLGFYDVVELYNATCKLNVWTRGDVARLLRECIATDINPWHAPFYSGTYNFSQRITPLEISLRLFQAIRNL